MLNLVSVPEEISAIVSTVHVSTDDVVHGICQNSSVLKEVSDPSISAQIKQDLASFFSQCTDDTVNSWYAFHQSHISGHDTDPNNAFLQIFAKHDGELGCDPSTLAGDVSGAFLNAIYDIAAEDVQDQASVEALETLIGQATHCISQDFAATYRQVLQSTDMRNNDDIMDAIQVALIHSLPA
jgi:hypothetical protein